MNNKPKFTKTQIRTLGAEQCTEELMSLGLDIDGGLGQKRKRWREALYPNSVSGSSLSQVSSQTPLSQQSQPTTVLPNNKEQWLLIKRTLGPVYARIPKGSREKSCRTFTQLLNNVISHNNKEAWEQFLNFARCGLGNSSRGGTKQTSQATLINKRLRAFTSGLEYEEQLTQKKFKAKPPSKLKSKFRSN